MHGRQFLRAPRIAGCSRLLSAAAAPSEVSLRQGGAANVTELLQGASSKGRECSREHRPGGGACRPRRSRSVGSPRRLCRRPWASQDGHPFEAAVEQLRGLASGMRHGALPQRCATAEPLRRQGISAGSVSGFRTLPASYFYFFKGILDVALGGNIAWAIFLDAHVPLCALLGRGAR